MIKINLNHHLNDGTTDPENTEIDPTKEAAYQAIVNTLRADDAVYVQFDKTGSLDKQLINDRQSESKNFQVLQALANDDRITEFVVSEQFDFKNSNGDIESGSLGSIEYSSEVDTMVELGSWTREQAVGLGFSEEVSGSGIFGITLLPDGELAEDGDGKGSANENIVVLINSGLNEKDQTRTAAHEGFGHALFYILGKDPNHGNDRNAENQELENQIHECVIEAERNFSEKIIT